jgi:hypothetical protein
VSRLPDRPGKGGFPGSGRVSAAATDGRKLLHLHGYSTMR